MTFGVTQPRINDLLRGKIDKFSLDALVNMLAKAGNADRVAREEGGLSKSVAERANVESRKDGKAPDGPEDEAELEQREYSSPPCYLHEFDERQANATRKKREAAKPATDSTESPEAGSADE